MANCLKSRIYIRLEPPDWEALWYLGCDPEVIRLGLEPRTPTLKVLCSTSGASESTAFKRNVCFGIMEGCSNCRNAVPSEKRCKVRRFF